MIDINWTYKDKEILSHEDLHPDCTDFVYELEFEDGKKYLGKKTVRAIRRIKPTKAMLAIRKNYVRKELKDLPFKDYEGSSEENKSKVIVSKTILYQSRNKKTATYIEAYLLFENDVLFNEDYTNLNISGVFYDNSLDGLIEDKEND